MSQAVEAIFLAERKRLWHVAYRVCGVVADADEVAQETWIKWSCADTSAIERPEAWLTTVTTRLAIDRLRARQRFAER